MSDKIKINPILEKLDSFIKLYYKNLIIRGMIYSAGLLVGFLLAFSLLEYFGYFSTTVRTLLFFGYLLIALSIIAYYILNPGLSLFKIGKRITYAEAALIVSRHFPEIKDRLINTLHLEDQKKDFTGNLEILEAAIDQKSKAVRAIPFTGAIDKKENIRKLPYALIPLSVLLIIIASAPAIIQEPVERITNYRSEFERPMPFTINILNENLLITEGDDFDLQIGLHGEVLPADVFVIQDGIKRKAAKRSNNHYSFLFRNVRTSTKFQVEASGFLSKEFLITVHPRPEILAYSIKAEYPEYTRRSNEVFDNVGDLRIPVGTRLSWTFEVKNIDRLAFTAYTEPTLLLVTNKDESFTISKKVMQSFTYSVKNDNENALRSDSIYHEIIAIPDLFPEITVESIAEEGNPMMLYFTGIIKDDYGFSRLFFHLRAFNSKKAEERVNSKSYSLPFDRTSISQTFFHSFDFKTLTFENEDVIEYWFEIWDNDMVNGSKSSRTPVRRIEIASDSDLLAQLKEDQQQLKDDLVAMQVELNALSREIERMSMNILQKETISWEDSQRLQQLLDRQNELLNKAEELKKNNTSINQRQQERNVLNEEIINKQMELQKLFDDLMTDEMRALFEELQKLLDNMDRQKMMETLQKMEMTNEELVRNLDRNLELFRQLELEALITENVSKLKNLADEQEKLAELTVEGKISPEEILTEQERLADEFEKISEGLKEIEEKNEQLENKMDMIDLDSAIDDINESMQNSMDKMQDGKPGQSVPDQKKSSGQMNSLAENLMQMMADARNEQLGEDIKLLRKMLEDLIDTSFDLEELIDRTLRTNRIDPRFNELLSEQKRLIVNLNQIEDSLNALARRQISIEQFVLREIAQINHNIEEALKTLEDRNISQAATRQQYVMTAVNNLALMLSEALDQMNQEMANSSGDGESCPASGKGKGKGKPGMSTMKDLQQELNRQLQEMQQGSGKPGQDGKPQSGGMSGSEQFARMAAQQEALRQQLKQYIDELRNETGKTDGNLIKTLEDMEETEKDLVNRRLSNETLLRQERIMTRLLESEKAEMEREKEERRESREARDLNSQQDESVLELFRKKLLEQELLRSIPPQLNNFYRNKANDYFIQIKSP